MYAGKKNIFHGLYFMKEKKRTLACGVCRFSLYHHLFKFKPTKKNTKCLHLLLILHI